jgi:prepilin-type N-terminal cleavage/methylation domain-containing protein
MKNRRMNGARGFTLVEVLVGITVLTVALLGLAAAAGTSLRSMARSREEVQYWGDAQQVIDSLMGKGFGNVTSGSTTLRGRSITWTAGSAAAAPQLLTVIVERPNYSSRSTLVRDTIMLYLSKMVPGT